MASTRASASRRDWLRVIGDPVDRGATGIERAQDFQHAGATLGIELAVEADRTVSSGADSQLTSGLGCLRGLWAVGIQVREEAFTDPGQRGGVEPPRGGGQGLLGLGSVVRVGAVRDPAHGRGDHPQVGGPDRTGGQLRGGGGQDRGQDLPGQRPARGKQLGLLDPGLRLAPGQVEHPGQQPRRGAEPGRGPRVLLLKLPDHPEHPGIGPP